MKRQPWIAPVLSQINSHPSILYSIKTVMNLLVVVDTASAGDRELEAPRVSPSRWGLGLGPLPKKFLNFFYIKMACSGAL